MQHILRQEAVPSQLEDYSLQHQCICYIETLYFETLWIPDIGRLTFLGQRQTTAERVIGSNIAGHTVLGSDCASDQAATGAVVENFRRDAHLH